METPEWGSRRAARFWGVGQGLDAAHGTINMAVKGFVLYEQSTEWSAWADRAPLRSDGLEGQHGIGAAEREAV
ncbi:hypothetical protein, partial [Mesorhizobium sp. M7A.F.Ca.MR.148.00.0.0]|uniref:hypothetical protein n=1 Tax=Mesorhizobium sp. M7A.F.Ca.MR.148.00.0.0 TaxID=2496775 RepID=UPI0019CF7661